MHEFRVWAPEVKKMTVLLYGNEAPGKSEQGKGEQSAAQRLPMKGPDHDGWWSALAEAECGDTYAFLIDTDTAPYPDPRALDAADGVHGASRLYDHSRFQWHDPLWQGPPLTGAIVYEMHIGTFTKAGTFDAAIEHLPYLKELGVTHLEVMPIAEFPGDFGWGYDGVALFAVTQTYGGPDAFKRFVDSCHQIGLAVLLDVVYNHFGPVGNYTTKFGPYLTENHRTPWGAAVNFEEAGSDQVRRFFIDNALLWMRDYHVDGLRLDAVHEYMDRSAVHFMEQLSSEVDVLSSVLGRRLVLIAESDLNDPRLVKPREAGGMGMDAQWSDDFHHSLFTVLHQQDGPSRGYYDDFGSMELLAKSLKEVFVYDGEYSGFRKRTHGRRVGDLSAHHFLGYIQNHDQIGNRAVGDRIEHVIGPDKTKVALALVMMAPFIPMLFQGEEYAASTPFQYFAHHDDPEMAAAVSAGRQKEFAIFGWDESQIPDPESRETFERSKLNWNELVEPAHADMLDWTRKLIHLRRSSTSLNDGKLQAVHVRFDEEKRWLTMRRGHVLFALNLGIETQSVPNPDHFPLNLASKEGILLKDDQILLPPDSAAILCAQHS